ncbi:MAG: FHA domain-containing protein [Fibrobacteraceae bacterium]|nr:FHA domain-containing protein [Fibrobacteraceae bacterium]
MNNDFLLLEPSQSEIFRIGRKSDCNLVLEDRYVSREHASIRFENDLWILKNLSQSSGTFCNNLAVNEKTLEDGDVLSLGTQKISVSIKNKTLQILLIKNN